MGGQMDDFVAKVVDQDGEFCNIDATRVPNTDRAIPNVAFDRTIDTAHAASAASIDGKFPALPAGDTVYPMAPDNVKSFGHTFPAGAVDSGLWTASAGAGAIIQNDGNCIAASYLVMSLDPFTAGSESSVVTTQAYKMPIELGLGIHTSQVSIGQEFYVEVVTADEVMSAFAELAISSIQQATTTLTINFATPHKLQPGMRIGVYGVPDTRLNHAAIYVASCPSATQITVNTSTYSGIGSQNVGPFTAGYVYYRPALGYAVDGASMVIDSNAQTNAGFYLRSDGGDVHPTGTIIGTQQTVVATRASVQPFALRGSYNFQPTNEVRLSMEPGRVEWSDVPVDSVAAAVQRLVRTQVTPNPAKSYKLRFRAVNTKSMSYVVAQIVSIAKTGTTTATVTTDVPHGLNTTSYVSIYGVRDQTNFPFLNGGLVTGTPTATTFTVVIGTASTNTSYGGAVQVVNASLGGTGFSTMAIQSASVATGSGRLTVIGSAAWTAGLLIGDYVNAIGVRLSSDGSPVNGGVDGAYRVFNVATTTLELEPIGATAVPTDFTTVNCGGAIVKRTDLRISFAKLNAFKRNRVEIMPRPAGDIAASIPVVINGTPAVTVSSGTITTVTTVTTVAAVTAANLAIPGIIQDVASAAITATATTAAITPTFGIGYKVVIPVTAMSGTTPTMDVGVEESDDTGTNWFRVYDFPRITGTGIYRSPPLVLTGNRIRYVQTIGGTSPSFTRSVQRLQRSDDAEPFRQLIDRAIALGTLNSATPILNTALCRQLQLIVSVGTIATTAPQLQLEGSDDGAASWYSIGSPLTAVASSTVQVTTTSDFNAALVRARVSTAGVGVAAASWYVLVKGF